MKDNPKLLFTFSHGRCGTGSLARMLSQLKREGSDDLIGHEFLQPSEVVGELTPGTDTLASYNCRGFSNKQVQLFWENKFQNLENMGVLNNDTLYAETSHVLCKAGLIEALLNQVARWKLLQVEPEIYILFLHRNPLDTMTSMLMRGDYHSLENRWVWYLCPSYKNCLLNYDAPSLPFGDTDHHQLNHIAWYYWEMRLRQAMFMELLAEIFHKQFRVYEIDSTDPDNFHKEVENVVSDIKREPISLEPEKVNTTPEQLETNKIAVRTQIYEDHSNLLTPFEGQGEEAITEAVEQLYGDFKTVFIDSQGVMAAREEIPNGNN